MRKSAASIGDVAATTFQKGKAEPSFVQSEDDSAAERLVPVTVRLTPTQFRELKHFGVDHGLKSQTILVEALTLYLAGKARGAAA